MRKNAPIEPVQAVTRYIAQNKLRPGERLPAERELAPLLGLSRSNLRQALAELESNGEVQRHVGRGTYLSRPTRRPSPLEPLKIASLTNPVELMAARLIIEPQTAALAAVYGSAQDFSRIMAALQQMEGEKILSRTQAQAESFHRAIAAASHNRLLQALTDILFEIRTAMHGRPAAPFNMAEDIQRMYAEHAAIAQAIVKRSAPEAEHRMRLHLESLQRQTESFSA